MFCSQFGTNLAPIPWNCLVLSLPTESTYIGNEDAMSMIYYSLECTILGYAAHSRKFEKSINIY